MHIKEAGVVILAAGRSVRMGELKAFLRFDELQPFIGKIISIYSGWGCREIVVVTNHEALPRMKQADIIPHGVTVIVNDHMEFERFYSVKLGLEAIISASFCFIQNIDNPFIDAGILDQLYGHRSDEKYVSPVFMGKGGHPVLLNRKNMDQICRWNENSATFKDVLKTMAVQTIDMKDDRVLININCPEDYHRLFQKAI
jgi:molybdenum cofactor cytidylyltransferase